MNNKTIPIPIPLIFLIYAKHYAKLFPVTLKRNTVKSSSPNLYTKKYQWGFLLKTRVNEYFILIEYYKNITKRYT